MRLTSKTALLLLFFFKRQRDEARLACDILGRQRQKKAIVLLCYSRNVSPKLPS